MSHKVPPTTSPWLRQDTDPAEAPPSPVAVGARAAAPVNLALYDGDSPNETVEHVRRMIRRSYSALQIQRVALMERWEKADGFYWQQQKEHRMPELTRAKVSASIFYQAVRRLSNGANIATFPSGADKLPVKAIPRANPYEGGEGKQKKALLAEAVNQFAIYSMAKAGIENKRSDAYYRVFKYGNLICYVPWDYEVEKRKRYEPFNPNDVVTGDSGVATYVHKETGETSPQPYPQELREVEYDYVCKDHVGFYPLPIENVWLDDNIDDIDRQPAVLWRSSVTRDEIWRMAKAGLWTNVDKISETNAYQFFNEQSQITQQRRADAGKSTASQEQTELYERWQCWMVLPRLEVKKNSKGEVTYLDWDQNAEPRRYLVEMVGNINEMSAVVVRFCESPYWGNGVPFIKASSHDDDVGFYHRGLTELLDDNMVQEQVAKGQLMDNRTLQNFRPMKRMIGRVRNKDMRITANTVFDVTHEGALTQLDIRDITQTILPSLQYIRDDSEKIAQTPKFMLGDAMGSRTSATEASMIRDSSSAPALNDVKCLNLQLWGGYMKKLMEYLPQFLSNDIAAGNLKITPDEFNDLDFQVQEVATTEFENKQMAQQILINLATVVQSPMFAGIINPAAFFTKLCAQFPSVFANPEELLIKAPAVGLLLKEWQTQQLQAQEQAQPGAQPPSPVAPSGAPTPQTAIGQGLAPDAGMATGDSLAALGGQAGGM